MSVIRQYLWAGGRNVQRDNEQLSMMMKAGTEAAFKNEDERMVAAVHTQTSMLDGVALKAVRFPTDAGAVRARRVLERRIVDEANVVDPSPSGLPDALIEQAAAR